MDSQRMTRETNWGETSHRCMDRTENAETGTMRGTLVSDACVPVGVVKTHYRASQAVKGWPTCFHGAAVWASICKQICHLSLSLRPVALAQCHRSAIATAAEQATMARVKGNYRQLRAAPDLRRKQLTEQLKPQHVRWNICLIGMGGENGTLSWLCNSVHDELALAAAGRWTAQGELQPLCCCSPAWQTDRQKHSWSQ